MPDPTLHGSLYRRCGCEAPDGRQLGRHCPDLAHRGHGTWTLDVRLPAGYGSDRPKRVRRGGFPTRAEAAAALADLQARDPFDREAAATTTGAWLLEWVEGPHRWRASTTANYRRHVHNYLVPYLGRIPLAALGRHHVQGMFDDLAARPSRFGHLLAPSSLARIQATLRSSLNAALRAGLLRTNPARYLALPPHPRIRAEVWTPGRVAVWAATGEHPTAAVWTPEQLAAFLTHRATAADPLLPAWRLIALRGLRRGEAAGLRWCDVDLDGGTGRATIRIVQAIIDLDGHPIPSPPKTAASRRLIALDPETTRILTAHHTSQAGLPQPSGYVFTDRRGAPIRPQQLTNRFREAVHDSGLPPVRLHDLRHGAASLALAAGVDLKAVQEMLGHASIITTADIYAHVLPELHTRAADAAAELVDRAEHPAPPLNH